MKRTFKYVSRIMMLICFCILSGCVATVAPKKDEVKIYTSYNIWIHRRSKNMMCINYKLGEKILPAGTEVRNVKIKRCKRSRRGKKGGYSDRFNSICFTTVKDDCDYRIRFNPRWHKGKSSNDYKNNMFSPKNFAELTKGFSEKEIKAIKQGVIVRGMSKQAVLCCYGYPPEHVTYGLDSNLWTYWINKWKKKKFCFNENDQVIHCDIFK